MRQDPIVALGRHNFKVSNPDFFIFRPIAIGYQNPLAAIIFYLHWALYIEQRYFFTIIIIVIVISAAAAVVVVGVVVIAVIISY